MAFAGMAGMPPARGPLWSGRMHEGHLFIQEIHELYTVIRHTYQVVGLFRLVPDGDAIS